MYVYGVGWGWGGYDGGGNCATSASGPTCPLAKQLRNNNSHLSQRLGGHPTPLTTPNTLSTPSTHRVAEREEQDKSRSTHLGAESHARGLERVVCREPDDNLENASLKRRVRRALDVPCPVVKIVPYLRCHASSGAIKFTSANDAAAAKDNHMVGKSNNESWCRLCGGAFDAVFSPLARKKNRRAKARTHRTGAACGQR